MFVTKSLVQRQILPFQVLFDRLALKRQARIGANLNPGPGAVRGLGRPLGGGVAPSAGAGGVMAQTWNQYCVPLVRPVTVQLEAWPT